MSLTKESKDESKCRKNQILKTAKNFHLYSLLLQSLGRGDEAIAEPSVGAGSVPLTWGFLHRPERSPCTGRLRLPRRCAVSIFWWIPGATCIVRCVTSFLSLAALHNFMVSDVFEIRDFWGFGSAQLLSCRDKDLLGDCSKRQRFHENSSFFLLKWESYWT